MRNTVAFDCPGCAQPYETEAARDGDQFKCSKCDMDFTILAKPLPDGDLSNGALVNFQCPKCGQSLEADGQMRGTTIECPQCQQQIEIPLRAIPEPRPAILEAAALPATPAGFKQRIKFVVTSGNEVAGHRIIEYLGIARGVVVRQLKAGESLVGGFERLLGGGNIDTYARMCDAAREEAYTRMVSHAASMSADAVIGFRYDATDFSPGVTEVLAYGTCVRLEAVPG